MKIFISHKNIDCEIALRIQNILKKANVAAYLDLLDDSIVREGKLLTSHIKNKLNECTDILVVMSENTKSSWWVPFEIGMAAQKDLPTVSFLKDGVDLPEYLSYWPRLKNDADLAKYVEVRNKVKNQFYFEKNIYGSAFTNSISETERFYNALKTELRRS